MIRVNLNWVIMVDQYNYTPVKDLHRTKVIVQDDGTEKIEQVYGRPIGHYTSLKGAVKAIARAEYKNSLSALMIKNRQPVREDPGGDKRMITCNKCGKSLPEIEADVFDHEGADDWVRFKIHPYYNEAVCVDLPTSWAGFDLSEGEARECIRCPQCKEYPFDDQEMHIHTQTTVVMFDKRAHPGESDISVEGIKQKIKERPGMRVAWGRLLELWEAEERERMVENEIACTEAG